MKLYRDLGDKKYVDSFFESGELQISSLYYFRTLEDSNRRDKAEGRKIWADNVNASLKPSKFGVKINAIDSNGETIKDLAFRRTIDIANCFALSFFQENKRPQTSIRINNPKVFSDVVGEELDKIIEIGCDIHGPCFYYSSENNDHTIDRIDFELFKIINNNLILAAFLKNNYYKEDEEYRMLWVPNYDGKSAARATDRFRTYAHRAPDRALYWPHGTAFPEDNEMIQNKIIIKSSKLIELVDVI